MGIEKLKNKLNGLSRRTRVIIGLCLIVAALIFWVWDSYRAHKDFWDASDFKKQYEGY